MGAAAVYTVTSATTSARDEQGERVQRYLFTMGIRTACFLLAIVLEGPWRWVAAFSAIVLPYVAVVAANAVAPKRKGTASIVVPSSHAEHRSLGT